MSERRHKTRREKDITSRFLSGDFDEDRHESRQQFSDRSKNAQQSKIEQTALLRAAEEQAAGDLGSLPVGQVIQVYSLFCQVAHETGIRLCVVRKTLGKLSESAIVVGDFVRFRDTGSIDESGRPEAVIEQVLPRKTILTRAPGRHGYRPQPIVANADQMLVVASLVQPRVKWGLVDRMIIAAQSGGLVPIVCLNKIDLADQTASARSEFSFAQEALKHYQSLGIATIQASVNYKMGIDRIAASLKGKATVLAGHSGVGKSTLIGAIQPGLDIRVGDVSLATQKGRHTTTSALRYRLDLGGDVIDTPGVKVFGLMLRREALEDFFPDVRDGTAPSWRVESYRRIYESLDEIE